MKHSKINLIALTTCLLAFAANGVIADGLQAISQSSIAPIKVETLQPKEPQCAPGFQVKNKHLNTVGGKSWYDYQCVRQNNIYRFCNDGLAVLGPKNSFSNLAGTPDQVNSILRMSYTCAKPAG